jgi:hypothetical protein
MQKPKTLYASCLSRLGLSQSEAATLHGSRLDTVRSWSVGRRTVPAGVWEDLRGYEARILDRSEAIRQAWEAAGESRDIDLQTHGDPVALMAVAHFLLSTHTDPPVRITVHD